MKSLLKKLVRYFLLPLLALLVVASLIGGGYLAYQQHRTARDIAITAPGGIQSLEKVTLGGVEQWISIRGQDRENPVLLFLHGGPGSPEMVPVRHYNRELEEHFVVVNWDQRGAGKSFSSQIPPDTMTLEQIVADAIELTQHLQERFGTEKIFLVGHSWGSIVGAHAAQKNPEYYHAFVGIGQAVNFVEAEKISYNYTLERARELNNEQALKELKEIGPPPYTGDDFQTRIGTQRKWLFRFGGEVYGQRDQIRYWLNMVKLHLFAPEYALADVINWLRGNMWSARLMWDDLLALNLPKQVPRLEIPVYFFAGRHDYVTVFEKVEEYHQSLDAPRKELVWFEESAHSPNFEEPGRFVREMVRVKRETFQ